MNVGRKDTTTLLTALNLAVDYEESFLLSYPRNPVNEQDKIVVERTKNLIKSFREIAQKLRRVTS